MPTAKLRQQRLTERMVVLAISAALALNYPLLFLFGAPKLLFGVPVLYLYLFSVWLLVIVLSALIEERGLGPASGDARPKVADPPDA